LGSRFIAIYWRFLLLHFCFISFEFLLVKEKLPPEFSQRRNSLRVIVGWKEIVLIE